MQDYCPKHNRTWDTNEYFKCPQCVIDNATEATEKTRPGFSTVADGSVTEVQALKDLCEELLAAATRCGEAPYYIVPLFLGIVKRHAATIKEHELM